MTGFTGYTGLARILSILSILSRMHLKSRLEGSEKLLARQKDPGAVARKVDMFETELYRLGLHEHRYEDRNEFGQKVADLWEKVDYWKQVLAGLDILYRMHTTNRI